MRYAAKDLKQLNGRKYFTLTQNKSALMFVDDFKDTIKYPSENAKEIPRSMIYKRLITLMSEAF